MSISKEDELAITVLAHRAAEDSDYENGIDQPTRQRAYDAFFNGYKAGATKAALDAHVKIAQLREALNAGAELVQFVTSGADNEFLPKTRARKMQQACEAVVAAYQKALHLIDLRLP